ncbi:Glycoside hydrolase superfamily [Phytophthora cactorum]|nr:Glycoside hydrolase superfamily [Phytophthora cactorum]
MATEFTAYGTSSLASDERLSARSAARRKWIRWGLISASTGIVLAGMNTESFIAIDVDTKFQEIMGFGGAFTEAAALQFHKLPKDKQEEVLTLYFDKNKGSAYSFGRVPMGSCDFSVASYNFAETENDMELVNFDTNVTHDTEMMIPFIKRALERRPDMKMFLAPWSPPAWMKRSSSKYNASMLGSMKPVGLRDDMRAPWALYFSKFITAYKKHGIPFWGFNAPWEACMYNPEYEAEFIGEFLVLRWADVIYNHPTASKYVDGIAFHWYEDGGERYMDGVAYPEHLNDTHFVNQSRFTLSSESSSCPGVASEMRRGFEANATGNVCDAAIIVTESGDDYFVQPMYYFIQHFSKFIPPGSRRVKTKAIHRTEDNKMQVTGTSFCLDLVNTPTGQHEVRLVECQWTPQTWNFEKDTQRIRIHDYCLSLNHGSTEDGVRITADKCEADVASYQQWTFNAETARCARTLGYSFVQAAAFVAPQNRKVLVGNAVLDTTIAPGAIRTYVWA